MNELSQPRGPVPRDSTKTKVDMLYVAAIMQLMERVTQTKSNIGMSAEAAELWRNAQRLFLLLGRSIQSHSCVSWRQTKWRKQTCATDGVYAFKLTLDTHLPKLKKLWMEAQWSKQWDMGVVIVFRPIRHFTGPSRVKAPTLFRMLLKINTAVAAGCLPYSRLTLAASELHFANHFINNELDHVDGTSSSSSVIADSALNEQWSAIQTCSLLFSRELARFQGWSFFEEGCTLASARSLSINFPCEAQFFEIFFLYHVTQEAELPTFNCPQKRTRFSRSLTLPH